MTKTKDLILKLRAVFKEKKDAEGLSYDKLLSLMEQDNEYTSKTTLSRLFGKNWEKHSFDYERTLIPIANALLDVENYEDDDDNSIKAFKSLLHFKMAVIDNNANEIAGLKESIEQLKAETAERINREKEKYHEKLQAETDKFQRSLDFAENQIDLKDKRIDQLMDMNHELMKQLLSCPNRGCKNEE